MAGIGYAMLGFISTLLLNDLFGWIYIGDIAKAVTLGMCGAAGGWSVKMVLDFIKKRIINYYKTKTKAKNQNEKFE